MRHRSARVAPLRWLGETARSIGRRERRAARVVFAWARLGGGRFVVPALAILVVLAASGAGGGYLVPTLEKTPVAKTQPSADPAPVPDLPGGGEPGDPPVIGSPGATPRPQSGLAVWAGTLSPTLGVPAVALAAYGYAELATVEQTPSCHLHWSTLAGIGKVESDHGRANGATLSPDGHTQPPIVGPALNGTAGTQLIKDTDHGQLDGDTQYDHAIGPFQFIPSTWALYKVDADRDGVADPNDINDAALAAAHYLCAGNRDLATAEGWWQAVTSYNNLQSYVQAVFKAANEYGAQSRSVT